MPRRTFLTKRSAKLALLVFGVLLAGAWAQTESVLYSFCAQTKGDVCTDGRSPEVGVVFDQKGNLYGTTYFGGGYNNVCGDPRGCGAVFKLTPEGRETVLHRFCQQINCADGEWPEAGLVLDRKGNLYGTTFGGGIHNPSVCGFEGNGCGVVFKLTPEGEETVLYSFCAQYKGGICTDGQYPTAGLVFDQAGSLYGTTQSGGAYNGGVVFKLSLEGKETVLYSFCAQNNCSDGVDPSAGLVFDKKGNLYGTTVSGGAHNSRQGGGVVFKLTPEGKEIVLYSFCAQNNCADGSLPYAGLTFDQKGNLYGMTISGGVYTGCYPGGPGCGIVFKLTPKAKETVLYSFCAQNNCTDGAGPVAGLVFDQKGNLYGTTDGGGVYNGGECLDGCGVVFRLTSKGKETVLHSFCADGGCADGAFPAGLTFSHRGNLYGTAVNGGAYNAGIVFNLTP